MLVCLLQLSRPLVLLSFYITLMDFNGCDGDESLLFVVAGRVDGDA